MKFGSLFTGIGGFDLGFERAGMECAWQVEKDKDCLALLEKRFPNAKRITDVKYANWPLNLKPVDVVCGGFPCQDLSVAGRRAGLAGKRSGLWYEFHRIVAEITPQWVLIENVPGLLSSKEGRDFAILLRGLVELGYGVTWRVLNSNAFGVAQHRRRVFILASHGDGRAAQVLFESEGLSWSSEESGSSQKTTTGTSAPRPASGGRPDGDPELDGYRAFTVAEFGGYKEVLGTLRASGGDVGGGSENLITKTLLAKRGYRANVDENLLIQTGGVRRLTPLECERLQSFPDGWTEGFSDSARYQMLGNAVTVNVIEWIARRIVNEQH